MAVGRCRICGILFQTSEEDACDPRGCVCGDCYKKYGVTNAQEFTEKYAADIKH